MLIGVIGLGYVGLLLANAFAEKYNVVGFDINHNRINSLKKLTPQELGVNVGKSLILTDSIIDICNCNYFIITVPTPINKNNEPDLSLLINATKLVSSVLKNDDIVIFESTVYPGVTEEVCVPILEKGSGLVFNNDFQVGYSPERINPGDKLHTIKKIKKVISGSSKEAETKIYELYSSIIDAGVYIAESIKVAEAAKVIENAQRDLNIAFVNELAQIFYKMGIDTNEVLEAASTNSQASKELLIQKFGLDGGKIKVIYNGFLGDHIKYSKQVKNKQFTVGFIGRLDTPKGVEVLIKAAKKLIKYKFKIAGNGPLKNFLKGESNSFDNIEFVGRVNNPFNFINNIDLLVVPSVREPLGNVIIEAGFLKKPVIASRVYGISELITDNESGILLMPKCELDKNFDGTLKHPEYVINGITKKLDQPKNIDYLELSNTIEELADDRKKREFLSNNLNKKVLKNCKLVNYFNQLENVYNTF